MNKDREPIGMADRLPEPEISQVEPERFAVEGVDDVARAMARRSVGSAIDINRALLVRNPAKALSQVPIEDPNLRFSSAELKNPSDETLSLAVPLVLARAQVVEKEFHLKPKEKTAITTLKSKARKAALGLAAFSMVASACTSEAKPTVTSTPFNTEPVSTEVSPTETSTAIPTEEPATPTKEPSPTPTEVPLYVGLPANEIETLRQECLQENPNSLCLPLPVSPVGQNLQVQEVSEVTIDVDTSNGRLRVEDFYLTLPLPFLSTVRSLGDGEIRVFASHPDSRGIWGDPVKEGRDLTKFDYLIFHWGPFQGDFPELALWIRKADGSKFSPEDLVLLVGDRQDVSLHQSLVTVGGTDLVLRIYRYGPLHMVAGFPVSESRVTLGDLLRNDAGSIVYALPPIG